MNENIDLIQILKNCTKGFAFYSSVHGKLYYDGMYVDSSASKIYFRSATSRYIADGTPILIIYLRDGRLYNGEGECTIFPSKDQRDWSKFSAPWYKKPKFDPKTLQPFDKVLVRDSNNVTDSRLSLWKCQILSFITEDEDYPYVCIEESYSFCIPYNEDTKHLVGTTEKAPEFYRYWEN